MNYTLNLNLKTFSAYYKNTKSNRVLFLFLFFVFCQNSQLFAQDDLMSQLEDKPHKEYIKNAFKSSRVINAHSMEFIGHGVLDFRILHRFGSVRGGAYELFGLDQASMRMGFDYGVTKNLTLGFGRSTFNKEYDFFAKYRPMWQSKGEHARPFSIVLVSGMTINSVKWADKTRKNYFTSRMGYYFQLIVGRKFNERFTLQLMPTMVHRNIVPLTTDHNDIYAIGLGTRVKVTKRIALVFEYFYLVNGRPKTFVYNPISIGIDIETGGHVFQLHFSNSRGMNEKAFITETTNNPFKGNINLGFNLSRVFTVHTPNKLM